MPTFRNKISTKCHTCGTPVAVKEGWTEGPPWITKCNPCSGQVEVEPKIKLTAEGNMVAVAPVGFLGSEKFAQYRAATEGAKYEATRRLNILPIAKVAQIVSKLQAAGFTLDVDPTLVAAVQAITAQTKDLVKDAGERAEQVDRALRERGLFLFPFQKSGVGWLVPRSGALLADEMGLGKTIQVLISLPKDAPVLVIAPAVAKGVWAREAAKWRPDLKVVKLTGRGSFRYPRKGEMVVTNYDILPNLDKNELDLCVNQPETVVVADEAHALLNSKTKRTKSFRAISETVRGDRGRVWLLTATPLLNDPVGLWNLFQAADIAREAFGSWKQFVALFNGYEGDFGGYVWGDPTPEVAERIRRVSLRRLRVDVLPELPVKTWREISVDLDSKTSKALEAATLFFKQFVPTAWDWLKGDEDEDPREGRPVREGISMEDIQKAKAVLATHGHTSFSSMAHGRELLAKAKIPTLLQLVEEFEGQNEPVVVFSAHRAPIDFIGEREGWAVITGDTSPDDRTAIEDAFQQGKLKGVAATIRAGGVAITLTRAHNVVFVDRDFTPALNDQAEDRVCRIGQSRGVIVWDLVANHPLDEILYEILGRKEILIDASVGASKVIEVTVTTAAPDFATIQADAAAKAAAEAAAKAEAERIAKERAEQAELLRKDNEDKERTEKEREKSENKKRRARERAVARGWVEAADHPERHAPVNAREVWASNAIQQLSALDPDHAQVENEVGFNKADGYVGHWLSQELPLGLTPKQWALAIKLCHKYHGQIGECPQE